MYCNRLKLRFGCLFAFIITPIVFAMEVGEKDSTKNAKSKPSSISKLFLRKIAQEYSFDENSSDLDILHATIDIFDQFIIQTDFMVKVLETKKADCKKKIYF